MCMQFNFVTCLEKYTVYIFVKHLKTIGTAYRVGKYTFTDITVTRKIFSFYKYFCDHTLALTSNTNFLVAALGAGIGD